MEKHIKRRQLMARWQDNEGRAKREQIITDLRTRKAIPREVAAPTAAEEELQWPDLRLIDLSGQNLDGVDLSGARLQGANLARSSFKRAKLVRADLRDTLLRNTDFTGADLRGASLAGAVMENTKFKEADMTGAVISKDTIIAGTTKLPSDVERPSKASPWLGDSKINSDQE